MNLALKIIVPLVILFGAGYATAIFVLNPLSDLQETTMKIQLDQMAEEWAYEKNKDDGNVCLKAAHATVQKEWNKACFSRGEKADCLLPLYERIDLTMEYNDQRIDCLINVI